MAIRPNPKKPAAKRPAKIVAIPADPAASGYISPFDAAAHYADYDHEAVKALSRKTLITPLTYNRRGTVEMCIGATNRHKMEAKLYIHDDGSDEYDEEWLAQFCDRVYRHERSMGGKRGVKNLRSNITKSVLGDFKPEIFKPWLDEDFGSDGPEYLYHVDSDGLHDPHFFYRLHEIMGMYPNWGTICLYNAKFHSPRGKRTENGVIDPYTSVRGMAAGISMFFRMKSFRDNPKKVQVPDGRGWDGFYSREIACRKVVTSLVSFVEHYGKWGFHNKGNFDRDKAMNPTKYLFEGRPATIDKIEAEHKRTASRMRQAEKAKSQE
jgi:hypothetical protein